MSRSAIVAGWSVRSAGAVQVTGEGMPRSCRPLPTTASPFAHPVACASAHRPARGRRGAGRRAPGRRPRVDDHQPRAAAAGQPAGRAGDRAGRTRGGGAVPATIALVDGRPASGWTTRLWSDRRRRRRRQGEHPRPGRGRRPRRRRARPRWPRPRTSPRSAGHRGVRHRRPRRRAPRGAASTWDESADLAALAAHRRSASSAPG